MPSKQPLSEAPWLRAKPGGKRCNFIGVGTKLLINWGNHNFLLPELAPHAMQRDKCNTDFVLRILYRSAA